MKSKYLVYMLVGVLILVIGGGFNYVADTIKGEVNNYEEVLCVDKRGSYMQDVSCMALVEQHQISYTFFSLSSMLLIIIGTAMGVLNGLLMLFGDGK